MTGSGRPPVASAPQPDPDQSAKVTARIVKVRLAMHFAGRPVALSGILRLPASTIGAVLRREGLPALARLDRMTGEIIRASARRRRSATSTANQARCCTSTSKSSAGSQTAAAGALHGQAASSIRGRGRGWDFVHVAIDDYSRVVYSEVLPDEKGPTCAAFLHRAAAWFHDPTASRSAGC